MSTNDCLAEGWFLGKLCDFATGRCKPRRSNETRSAEMRAALIEAAIQSLCEVGYSKTTTQEICRRARATSGAIQHHFGSKDELILATLDCLRLEMQERFDRLNELGGPLQARCEAMVREMWHTFYGRKRYMAVWEIAIGSRGRATLLQSGARAAPEHAALHRTDLAQDPWNFRQWPA